MRVGGPPMETFIPDFIKIIQLVQKLKGGTHREHSELIRLLFFPKKGK